MGSGLRLKTVLRDHKMTIKQLSEKADISLNTLYSITKRDTEHIDLAILVRICDALNITVDEFYGINPLPTLQLPILHGYDLYGEYYGHQQEEEAFTDYLNKMGYNLILDLASFEENNPEHMLSLYDNRSNKKYYVPTETLDKLMYTVNTFLKYQISEVISSAVEVPREKEIPKTPSELAKTIAESNK